MCGDTEWSRNRRSRQVDNEYWSLLRPVQEALELGVSSVDFDRATILSWANQFSPKEVWGKYPSVARWLNLPKE